jgi:hypothetical protein
MNIFNNLMKNWNQRWYPQENAKAYGEKLCKELNEKIEKGESRYVYGDQPITECKCAEPNQRENGGFYSVIEIVTKTNCYVEQYAKFYGVEKGFSKTNLLEHTWMKKSSELTQNLGRFGIREVSEKAFEMVKWIHRDTSGYVEVDTTGQTITVTESYDNGSADWEEIGEGFKHCRLVFKNDESVVFDTTAVMDDYHRFTCLKPEFSIKDANHASMNCSNLKGDIEFRRTPRNKV